MPKVIDFNSCQRIGKKNKNQDNNGGENTNCPYIDTFKSEISNLKTYITVIVAIFGIITPLMFAIHSSSIDRVFESYNKQMDSKFELINNQFENFNKAIDLKIENQALKSKNNIFKTK